MYRELEKINHRPKPFQLYSAEDLWTDSHTSRKMLEYHLNESIDISSRNRKFIDRSVEWISSQFAIHQQKNIIDFGCGPGLYTTALAERGARVTGIDFSTRSVAYARNTAKLKKLKIKYVRENYLNYKSNMKYDLILMIMCDYCALSPRQRNLLLDKFYGLLNTGGSVLLDVYSLNAFRKRNETVLYQLNLLEGFWSANKYYGFLNTFKYEEEKVVLDKYTIIEKNRTRTIYNWLQYFSADMLKKEFNDHQFSVVNILSDVAGSAYDPDGLEMAIVARKAG